MVPVETTRRDGKGEDGRTRTREVKLAVFFTQDKLDDKGYPVRNPAPPATSPPSSPRTSSLAWSRPTASAAARTTSASSPFHPLDGARFLRCAGFDGQVVSLVAYHSCAQVEADVRGLGAELAAELTPVGPLLTDALLYCDMTTGPDGDYVRPADRLAEIRGRYGPGHEVTRFIELAASEILTAAGHIEIMLVSRA